MVHQNLAEQYRPSQAAAEEAAAGSDGSVAADHHRLFI